MPSDKMEALAKRRAIYGTSETKAESMVNSGYSPATAKNPSQIMELPGFQSLLEKYLPDNEILGVHKDLMQNSDNDNVKLGAVKLAHQVKGHLTESSRAPSVISFEFNNAPSDLMIKGEATEVEKPVISVVTD
jgi:hypothetical protein